MNTEIQPVHIVFLMFCMVLGDKSSPGQILAGAWRRADKQVYELRNEGGEGGGAGDSKVGEGVCCRGSPPPCDLGISVKF